MYKVRTRATSSVQSSPLSPPAKADDTHRWESARGSRAACEWIRRDGVGVCASHSVSCLPCARMRLWTSGVSNALQWRRWRFGDRLLCGVGGKRTEGADVREDESEGGSFNDAGATCANTSGGSLAKHPFGACSD